MPPDTGSEPRRYVENTFLDQGALGWTLGALQILIYTFTRCRASLRWRAFSGNTSCASNLHSGLSVRKLIYGQQLFQSRRR